MTQTILYRDPAIGDAAAVFIGARAPVKTLTDYLEAGDTIDVFLEDFPSVARAYVVGFLQQARAALSGPA